jgi:hypothetical protein
MIKQAAIKLHGRIHTLPRPVRHNAIFRDMRQGGKFFSQWECTQGFITEDGEFVDREQADEFKNYN